MMNSKTKILYYFDSNSHVLVEIKLDIKNETDKSKLYYWLLYDKYNLNYFASNSSGF